MDENGYMLTDTITPDGKYVNANGEKTNYIPGWYQDAGGWHYIMKNGYYAGATWIQDTDGNGTISTSEPTWKPMTLHQMVTM